MCLVPPGREMPMTAWARRALGRTASKAAGPHPDPSREVGGGGGLPLAGLPHAAAAGPGVGWYQERSASWNLTSGVRK